MENLDLIIPGDDTLSPEELQILQVKLWGLLGERTGRYTMGDSSSVPVELAQELLTSICFTLGIYLKEIGETQKLLVSADLSQLLKVGIRIIESQIETGKQLWQAACLSAPEIENIAYRDTLKSIGKFFKRYNRHFLAHQIPCSIDYPLCDPVPEQTMGIEYINEYLRRILMENDVLRRFDPCLTIRLLEGYCSDYRELLINLCEPVVTNAVGLVLIGGDPLPLEILDTHCARLAEIFVPLSEPEARRVLHEAAGRLCRMLNVENTVEQTYLVHLAAELAPRIFAALPYGNLNGVFTPSTEPENP